MPTLTNPVACPTCNAVIGEPCSTRSGKDAARPHKPRREAPIPFGQHTEDCRAHAVACAAENIADMDAETRARWNPDPIDAGDEYLASGTVQCLCWATDARWAHSWIRKGRQILADAVPTWTTVQIDSNGTSPVPGGPTRQYRAASARLAASLHAATVMTRDEYWQATLDVIEGDGWVAWTFTPSTGTPVCIRVAPTTEQDTKAAVLADIQRTAEAKRDTIAELFGSTTKPDTTPEPEPATPASTVVDTITIHDTNPNWAPVFAMARRDAAAQTHADAVATRSEWDSALANLRDALQDAGVPPETTDNLVIRHDPEDSWLTDIETGKHLMRVESPSILEDALYGLAWAYGLGRPTPIRPYPIPRSERASQRATAAV